MLSQTGSDKFMFFCLCFFFSHKFILFVILAKTLFTLLDLCVSYRDTKKSGWHFFGRWKFICDFGKKKLFTLLDLCVSSLRRGHANLLCIVPILTGGTPFGDQLYIGDYFIYNKNNTHAKVGGVIAFRYYIWFLFEGFFFVLRKEKMCFVFKAALFFFF